jgi:hypothetical protein
MSNSKKWEVSFTTPESKGRILKETVEDTQWSGAKLKMESKYSGAKITNYTPSKSK